MPTPARRLSRSQTCWRESRAAACKRREEHATPKPMATTSPSPPQMTVSPSPPQAYIAPCDPQITITSEWKSGEAPGFVAEFTIPDWLPESQVRISMPEIYRVVNCYGVDGFQEATASGTFITMLGQNPAGPDKQGGKFSCQLEGKHHQAGTIVEYVGARCFANPPPPPSHFSACDSAVFSWPPAGGFWRGTVTVDEWTPGREIRVDFGSQGTLKIGMVYNAKSKVGKDGVAVFWLGKEAQFKMQASIDCPAPCYMSNQFSFDVKQAPHEVDPTVLCEAPWDPPPSPSPMPPPSPKPPPPTPMPPPPHPPSPPPPSPSPPTKRIDEDKDEVEEPMGSVLEIEEADQEDGKQLLLASPSPSPESVLIDSAPTTTTHNTHSTKAPTPQHGHTSAQQSQAGKYDPKPEPGTQSSPGSTLYIILLGAALCVAWRYRFLIVPSPTAKPPPAGPEPISVVVADPATPPPKKPKRAKSKKDKPGAQELVSLTAGD